MSWSAPTTRVTGELITAAIWNADIVDNLNALKAPNSASYKFNEASNYTTTSVPFDNVDATSGKGSLPITLAVQADVMIWFAGAGKNTTAAGSVYMDVTRDGVSVSGDDGILLVTNPAAAVVVANLSFTWWDMAVAAGAHTYNLRWKVGSGGGTGTLYAGAGTSGLDIHPQFGIREAS